MRKEELAAELKALLENDFEEGGVCESYGFGEFAVGTLVELIPYLNKAGLEYLKQEIHRCFEDEIRTGITEAPGCM